MSPSQPHELTPPATFEQWMAWMFDHPVTEPPWYWEDVTPDPEPAQALAYMTALFEAPEGPLRAYSDAQVNLGLWYLAGGIHSHQIRAFTDLDLAEDQRLRGVRAIGTLYTDLFAKRCTPHLSHLDEAGAGALNSVCWMLWDVAPLPARREHAVLASVNLAAIDVMEACLLLEHDACRESALHGLGHNAQCAPLQPRIHAIIDAFLARTPELRPELAAYALCARTGLVQ